MGGTANQESESENLDCAHSGVRLDRHLPAPRSGEWSMKETDVLVVGFGFSAIPLLRELDLSGVSYTIISEQDGSVWARLAGSGGIDFDLVSSYYSSFYTFDLVEDFSEDRYPTAR